MVLCNLSSLMSPANIIAVYSAFSCTDGTDEFEPLYMSLLNLELPCRDALVLLPSAPTLFIPS